MLDTMQSHLNEGGRLMYLGGNGFYWVTTINPDDPHVFEVRRWGGTGTWNASPGEFRNSTTGEPGGMWRQRGRHPQKMLGVGFTSQGFDANRPYRRAQSSFDKRASFVFEGIGGDELIGDFPSLVQNHGAAGSSWTGWTTRWALHLTRSFSLRRPGSATATSTSSRRTRCPAISREESSAIW